MADKTYFLNWHAKPVSIHVDFLNYFVGVRVVGRVLVGDIILGKVEDLGYGRAVEDRFSE